VTTATGPGYLGIDIGGTKVALGAASAAGAAAGEVGWSNEVRWPAPAVAVERDLAVLREAVDSLRRAVGRSFAGVGVAVAATVDPVGRVTTWPTRPSWTGLDLIGVVRSLVPGCGVVWGDDGALAAVAEAAATGVRDLVYVGVGTGVGGGIIAGGRSVPALARGSCELGHLVVNRAGAVCDCGRRGCVQAESSGPVTLRRAAVLRGRPVSFDELRAGYANGEPWASAAVGHSCAALASALAGAGELASPAIHVVGGGFATGITGFVDEVARRAAALSRPGHPVAPVVPARFGGRSSLRGAIVAAAGLHEGGSTEE
jgi:kanosamine 6-kinase